jgi:hypothetical protein
MLARAVSGVLPARDVAMDVSAVPLIAGRRGAAVIVGRLGTRVAGPITMLTAAFTPRAAPVVSRRATSRATAASARDGGGPLGIVSALALSPGAYEIRVATELPGGAAGSVHTFVDVPDFARERLSLSGVLWHVAPEEPSAPREEIDGALPFAPTARRAFARTESVSIFVQVSQGLTRKDLLQPVTLRVQVRDAQDHAVRDSLQTLMPATFGANRTANARLPLPLQGLAAGHYLLSLDATMGERRASRSVRFAVE